MIFKDEPGTLFIGQALLDEGKIQIFVTTVNLVADDRVAEVRKVNADLMFAASARLDAQKRKIGGARLRRALTFRNNWDSRGLSPYHMEVKPSFHPKFCLGGGTIGAHAVFHGDDAAFVLAERRINNAAILTHVAVNDGEIFFLNGTAFHNFSQFTRDDGIFCHDDHAAGFAIKTIDKMGRGNG